MPLANRVTPYGEIIAHGARGLFMGNRGGRIHDPVTKTLGNRRWASKQWICCVTRFKDRRRSVMGRGYTELFFLDEVTALSAGHRPCFECRRADALAFSKLWAEANGLREPPKAGGMDRILHGTRQISGQAQTERAAIDALPDGVMIEIDGVAMAVKGHDLLRWSPDGYDYRAAKSNYASGRPLTPEPIIKVLRAGYSPHWHPTAERVVIP